MNPTTFSLIGFLLSEIGLGQAARNIAHSLKKEKISSNFVNIHLDGRSNDQEFISECGPYRPGNINFVVCGLDLVGNFYSAIQESGLGSKNYLYPFWELDRVPYQKFKELSAYDEVLAPSKFIATALANFLGREIRTIPLPVKIPEIFNANDIQNGVMRIYSSMDFDSAVARKNPQGVLKAFLAAFPSSKKDVELILKVRGGSDVSSRAMLQDICSKDERIKIIDKTLSRKEIDELVGSCNVYLSMHRSEGFGFGPAEALALEKIVVATDYSGTSDFINSTTGYPVDFRLTPVKPGEYPFCENQLWAEPSIDSAVQALWEIYNDYDSALARARNGRQFMLDHHSFRSSGRLLKNLL